MKETSIQIVHAKISQLGKLTRDTIERCRDKLMRNTTGGCRDKL